MRYNVMICVLLISCMMYGQVRQEIILEKNWKFHKGDMPGAENPQLDDATWQQVVVPHDWAIYGPFDKEIDLQRVAIVQNGETVPSEKSGRTGALPYIGVGWYRTVLPLHTWSGDRRAILLFDGAMSEANVYVNGQRVGFWPNGYNSFYFDITPYLHSDGKNTLAVRLENLPESSRWYPGAGLYRPVRLQLTSTTAIDTWGTTVRTVKIADDFARISLKTEMNNAAGRKLRMLTRILNGNREQVAVSDGEIQFIDNETEEFFEIARPALWSPESPALYTAEQLIYDGDRLIDQYVTRFGIRDVKVIAGKGFMLNGEIRKFRGVCLHHDQGPIGTALNKAALRRQLQLMKDMGADAIRTAHNMPSSWQMELCDEMGLMVMAESFDEWAMAKCKNGYNRFFEEWAEKDLVNLIRCFRNHPSIVMWSVGNEVPEQNMPGGNRVARFLQDICHREDPTRPVTCGMDMVDNAVKNNFAAVFDVPGLNYRTHKYKSAYESLPQGFILGSETASTVSSRGVYKFPAKELKQHAYDDAQSSSYDLEACRWSNIPEDDWILQDDMPWVIGEFVWTGFDYLGEPTPYDEVWPSRSSYFGICDLAGLSKDRYFLYRSQWNKEAHTLHMLPHWTWPGREGETTPVYCYTGYPCAELFVNGKSQGKRYKDKTTREDRYRLRWNEVKYEPGTIRVIAYDESGKPVGEEEIRTSGKPYRISLSADRKDLRADGKDLAFVTVRVEDKDGNFCPDAADLLTFKVKGAGTYRAACNGDATSLEPFHLPRMKAFNGMLVVVVNAGEQSGDMTLEVKSRHLKSATIGLTVR